MTARFR
jgi:hypothetical protein